MNENTDLTSEIVKAIPESSWDRMVDTACRTFESCVSPITESTSGIGRLLKERFDRLVSCEKIRTAEVIRLAISKAESSGKPTMNISNPRIMLDVMECSTDTFDDTLKELWSNLLAHEITDGDIHPEIPRALSRLTAADAQLLDKIRSNQPTARMNRMWKTHFTSGAESRAKYFGDMRPKDSLSHAILSGLNIIEKDDGTWTITIFGEAFIKAVTDPELEEKKP